jgi:DNA-binding MarR family transcriptional regulator
MFFEAHAAVCDRVEAELQRRHGLSLRWYDVLLHLHAAPDGLTMRELSAAVVISSSGLTGLVDRMQRAGLVERTPDPGDRRITRVGLTSSGRAAYERARSDHRRAVADHFLDRLTAAESEVLEAALDRVRSGALAAAG